MFWKRTIPAAWVCPAGRTLQGANKQAAACIEQEGPDEKEEDRAHETSNPDV